MVLAPHDVGDGHVAVVDHVGQYEKRLAVRFAHAEILDGGIFVHDLAPDDVLPGSRARSGGAEPQQPPRAGPQVTVPAEAVITGRPADGFVALGYEVGRAVAGVHEVLVEKLFYGRLVQGAPLGLEVRAFVPVEAEPLHRPFDAFGMLRPVA